MKKLQDSNFLKYLNNLKSHQMHDVSIYLIYKFKTDEEILSFLNSLKDRKFINYQNIKNVSIGWSESKKQLLNIKAEIRTEGISYIKEKRTKRITYIIGIVGFIIAFLTFILTYLWPLNKLLMLLHK